LSSCRHSASGRCLSNHATTCGRRTLSELTFHVAMRMPKVSLCIVDILCTSPSLANQGQICRRRKADSSLEPVAK
jgi:hypothetical protein